MYSYNQYPTIHQRLDSPSSSHYSSELYSGTTASTARSSFSSVNPQSPWGLDDLSAPKLGGVYDNAYDYSAMFPEAVDQSIDAAYLANDLQLDLPTMYQDQLAYTQSVSEYPAYQQQQRPDPPQQQQQFRALPVHAQIPAPSLPASFAIPTRSQQRPANRYTLDDFVFHHTLGTGSFGRVHLGTFLLFSDVKGYSRPNSISSPK